MSLEENRWQSPYEEMKRERGTINNCMFLGAKTREVYQYCPMCHRNLVSFDDTGNTLICPQCGRKQEIKPAVPPAQEGLKQKNPPISKRNSFVISQPDKSKKDKQDKQKEIQELVGLRGGFITDVEEIEL